MPSLKGYTFPMSQEKVDRYKEEKRNRKKDMQKAKRNKLIAGIAALAVACVIIVWIAYSGYKSYEASLPSQEFEVSLDAITDYINSLTADE